MKGTHNDTKRVFDYAVLPTADIAPRALGQTMKVLAGSRTKRLAETHTVEQTAVTEETLAEGETALQCQLMNLPL